jgi:hypothetical protein
MWQDLSACRHRIAIGLTGDAVAPIRGNGAITARNVARCWAAHAAARASRPYLSGLSETPRSPLKMGGADRRQTDE